MPEDINDDEFLYRGIIKLNWDIANNRPSSATFKDSKGVSVDRDKHRNKDECIEFLRSKKDFYAICKVKTGDVKEKNAIVKHLPEDENEYHSEIHDSTTRVQMKGSKPKKIRDLSEVVYSK